MIDEQRLEALANAGDNAAWVELLRLRVRRGEDVLARVLKEPAMPALQYAALCPASCWPEHLRDLPSDLACTLHRADYGIKTVTGGTHLPGKNWAVYVQRTVTPRGGAKAGGWRMHLEAVGVLAPLTEPMNLCIAGYFKVLNQSNRPSEIKFWRMRFDSHLNLISRRCADLYRTHAPTHRSDA